MRAMTSATTSAMTSSRVIALALIAGCQALPVAPDPPPTTKNTSDIKPIADTIGNPADPRSGEIAAGQYHLAFEVSIESSCSQSWDLTTHAGAATLTIAPDRSARLELRVVNHSVGPDYDSWRWAGGSDPVLCVWLGSLEADRLRLEVQGPPSEAHYTCQTRSGEVAQEGFEARCRPGEAAGAVWCEGEPGLPWLMALMARRRPLALGPAGGEVARYFEGDNLIEGELIAPGGAATEGAP